MQRAPCAHCGELLTFDPGFTSGLGGQEMRAHTECHACGWMNAKVPGSDLVDAQPPDDFEDEVASPQS